MSVSLQAKLLRVIQERRAERLGDSRTIAVDVRLLIATNVDLRKAVQQGTFREDLYYRLNVLSLGLPPLRDRRTDIPALTQHFIRKSCQRYRLPLRIVTDDAMQALVSYTWPGNIRQLENAIEHAVVLGGGEATEISVHSLPEDVRRMNARMRSAAALRH